MRAAKVMHKTLLYVTLALLLLTFTLYIMALVFWNDDYSRLGSVCFLGYVPFGILLQLIDRRQWRRESRQIEAFEAAEEAQFRQWKCPNCGEAYGPDGFFVRRGGTKELLKAIEANPNRREAVIRRHYRVGLHCKNCRFFLNAFYADGVPLYPPGVLFDPQAIE